MESTFQEYQGFSEKAVTEESLPAYARAKSKLEDWMPYENELVGGRVVLQGFILVGCIMDYRAWLHSGVLQFQPEVLVKSFIKCRRFWLQCCSLLQGDTELEKYKQSSYMYSA